MRALGPFLALFFFAARILSAQDTFHGCKPQGTAKPAAIKTVNKFKNRTDPPADGDIDSTATLTKMLKIGDDTDRFDDDQGAEIVGYVYDVKPGGLETCNCKNPDELDTHIELVPSPSLNDKTRRVIVEVTPRWREKMATDGADWSTDAIKAKFNHKWVRVRGWLLFDIEHVGNASHTSPGGSNIWRATCWEVHPITSIEVTTTHP
jgi:hypothetical protein